mgnify:FL=1
MVAGYQHEYIPRRSGAPGARSDGPSLSDAAALARGARRRDEMEVGAPHWRRTSLAPPGEFPLRDGVPTRPELGSWPAYTAGHFQTYEPPERLPSALPPRLPRAPPPGASTRPSPPALAPLPPLRASSMPASAEEEESGTSRRLSKTCCECRRQHLRCDYSVREAEMHRRLAHLPVAARPRVQCTRCASRQLECCLF